MYVFSQSQDAETVSENQESMDQMSQYLATQQLSSENDYGTIGKSSDDNFGGSDCMPTRDEINLLKCLRYAKRPRRRRASKYDDLIKRLSKNQDVGEVLKTHSPSPKRGKN